MYGPATGSHAVTGFLEYRSPPITAKRSKSGQLTLTADRFSVILSTVPPGERFVGSSAAPPRRRALARVAKSRPFREAEPERAWLTGLPQMAMTSALTENGDGCLLEVEDVSKAFKGLLAVDGYSLRLRVREILGIIGPNGAGKTTLFNLLTGYIRPTRGKIHFQGQEITHRAPEQIAALGIGRTFQNIRLFPTMSVLENVKSAQQLHDRDNLITTLLTWPSFRHRETRLAQESLEQLALFELADRADQAATSLPYGDQRRLEIVRALALRPKLLLLDEPTAGMNPHESMEILRLIQQIRDLYDLTIIIVEHNMPVVMQLSHRIQALNYGQIIAEGTPDEIRSSPLVIEAYLGKSD